MAETQDSAQSTGPVLSYARVDRSDGIWAVRFVGSWILVMAGASLAQAAAHANSNGQRLAGSVCVAALLMAAVRRVSPRGLFLLTVGCMAAVIYQTKPWLSWPYMSTVGNSVVFAFALTGTAAGLCVLTRNRGGLIWAAILICLAPLLDIRFMGQAGFAVYMMVLGGADAHRCGVVRCLFGVFMRRG